VGKALTRQQDRQRARRNHRAGLSGPARARRLRQRQAEPLIAEVLNVLSQRDALANDLERRAGRYLLEIKALGWPSSQHTVELCGISLREAIRLRRLAEATAEGVDPAREESPPTAADPTNGLSNGERSALSLERQEAGD